MISAKEAQRASAPITRPSSVIGNAGNSRDTDIDVQQREERDDVADEARRPHAPRACA